jgi:hypothetical protein
MRQVSFFITAAIGHGAPRACAALLAKHFLHQANTHGRPNLSSLLSPNWLWYNATDSTRALQTALLFHSDDYCIPKAMICTLSANSQRSACCTGTAGQVGLLCVCATGFMLPRALLNKQTANKGRSETAVILQDDKFIRRPQCSSIRLRVSHSYKTNEHKNRWQMV